MARYPHFIGGSAEMQTVIADSERSVNLYVERAQSEGATSEAALFSTPGFRAWAQVADVGSRAFTLAAGRLFAVIGAGFYEFDSNGTATKHGAVAQDSNPAQIVYNGLVGGQLGIASGGNVYTFTLATNAFAAVGLLAGRATMIAYAHGYGLLFDKATGRVYISALNDLTTWDLGTFFQRSLFGDPWQAMFVDGNSLIWLPGTESFEVWYDTGQGTQPFAPLSGLVGRQGIASSFAWGLAGSSIYWLSANAAGAGTVVSVRGGSSADVSTYAVDAAIARYQRTSGIDDAEMLVYQDQGHTFVNTSFPSAPATWSLDTEGQGWSERGKWNPVRGAYDLWSPRVHVAAFGKHLVGDRSSGVIAVMDSAYATEIDGTGIRWMRRAPGLTREHARLPYDSFELLMDVGVGRPQAGQGSDPTVMLRVSSDGGVTWGNERRASMGRAGEYRRRVYWTRLGVNPHAVYEVSGSDPVPVRIVDAFLNNAEQAA